MKNWILEKWDWWVYRRSYNTMKRMAKRNIGFTYLMELHLREYNSHNPIPESLKSATEHFHNAMIDEEKKNNRQKT